MGRAIFAGGCFWCMEYIFDNVSGVIEAIPGYTGGECENPTYEEVSTGKTGHFESVLIEFDETEISYEKLLEKFWKSIDPTNPYGQFHDWGPQYRSAIFYFDELQKFLAEESRKRLEISGIFRGKIETMILPAKKFYPAEKYHRKYYKNFPHRFFPYKKASGREEFLKSKWRRFPYFRFFPEREAYWKGYKKEDYYFDNSIIEDNVLHENQGIYVEKISGEPLFSSINVFSKEKDLIKFNNTLEDFTIKLFKRKDKIIVRSKAGNLFLGYFENGKYKILKDSIRFIGKKEFEKTGYIHYLQIFRGEL